MSRYPLPTSINWSNGFQEVPQYVNVVTNSVFMNVLLIGIWFLFASGYWVARRDIFEAFAVGGFACWLGSLVLWLGSFVSGWTFAISTAVLILGFASLWIPRND